MATHKPAQANDEKFIESIKTNWASECCAEHDGSIADFTKLNTKLADLVNYEELFERKSWNIVKAGKIAGGMVAGAAVFCPLAYFAAPGVASALGAAGLLGTASTGTVISSLSGAALTSASLAALGPCGMTGGVFFVSAAGAALGASKGAVISNNYFGAIKDFKIAKVKTGTGPALIFINGFLSQKNQDPSDWIKSVKKKYPENPYYYVTWESKSLYEIGSLIGKSGSVVFQDLIKKLVARGSKKFVQKLYSLNWATTITELLGNPWHTSMVKASMTGILLADLLARTNQRDGYILMGHSLGSRVIYYLLNALATKDVSPIQDVFMLGGAIDRTDEAGWQNAVKAVNGKIYNCYSVNDSTLKFLYQGVNALSSSPIGLGKISHKNDKLINHDVSSIIEGHMQYKEKFNNILSSSVMA